MYVTGKRKGIAALFLLVILTAGMAFPALAAETEAAEYVPSMYATFWALVPPIVAIGLALITKEAVSYTHLPEGKAGGAVEPGL